MITTFLLILGLVLVVLQAVNAPSPPRFSFGWAGVACWMLVYLIRTWPTS